MRPSLGRWFRKIPNPEIGRRKHRFDVSAASGEAEPPSDSRTAKYRLVIAIACGLVVALGGFALLSKGLIRVPPLSAATLPAYEGLATSAFETALASQSGMPTAEAPTSAPLPEATSAALAEPVDSPANRWAAEIPEAACIPDDIPETGRVVQVVDGSTIRVLMDGDGRVYSVRYIGVDSPAVGGGQSFASAAAGRNAELVFHQTATLVRDISDADLAGMLLRYVLVGKVFINYELIAAGLARADSKPPDTACAARLQSAEDRAREAGMGMWAGPLP